MCLWSYVPVIIAHVIVAMLLNAILGLTSAAVLQSSEMTGGGNVHCDKSLLTVQTFNLFACSVNSF